MELLRTSNTTAVSKSYFARLDVSEGQPITGDNHGTSLEALALSDMVLLFCAFLQQVVPIFMNLSGCVNAVCLRIGCLRIYAWPVIYTAQMASIWLTVLISLERHSAVCQPLRAYGSSAVGKIKCSMGVIVVASALFNLPKFFEYSPKEEALLGTNLTYAVVADTSLRLHPAYRYLYNTALFSPFVYGSPIGAITLLNASIVVHVHIRRKPGC